MGRAAHGRDARRVPCQRVIVLPGIHEDVVHVRDRRGIPRLYRAVELPGVIEGRVHARGLARVPQQLLVELDGAVKDAGERGDGGRVPVEQWLVELTRLATKARGNVGSGMRARETGKGPLLPTGGDTPLNMFWMVIALEVFQSRD